VHIHFPGLGYAGLEEVWNQVPLVNRGFAMFGLSPEKGSVLGGVVLTIDGYGFEEAYPERMSVMLYVVGIEPWDEYDLTLMALGFLPYTVRLPHEEMICHVIYSNFTQLQCQLDPHYEIYPDLVYNVDVVLNGVHAECLDDNKCQYTQSIYDTPSVDTELLNVTEVDGVFEFWITAHFDARDNSTEDVTVYLGLNQCTILALEPLEYEWYEPTTVPTAMPTTETPSYMPSMAPTNWSSHPNNTMLSNSTNNTDTDYYIDPFTLLNCTFSNATDSNCTTAIPTSSPIIEPTAAPTQLPPTTPYIRRTTN
jgi:hypothetical protein